MASKQLMQDPVRIWAPLASRLEVLVGDRRIEAVRESGGWWRGPALANGADYAISADGGPPRPDPRSRWQPAGVHGRSRWIEPASVHAPSRFIQVPLRDAVIYELHVGTYSREGTFAGAIEHLDHLVELGVTHVELMPVAQFSGTHGWGYDGVDLYAPHAAYGGPAGLHALIGACHERKLAVLIDVVHNHLGPEGAYLPELGPYKTATHNTPWGEAMNLDADGSREVRRFLIDSAVMWLRDYGADGLRLDALHSLHDSSERHFVAELVDEVHVLERELGRSLVLIGEYDHHDPAAVTERAAGGWGLDAHWNDDFHHAVHALLTGEHAGYYADFADPATLDKVIANGYALDGAYSPIREAPHGKPYGDLWRDRLVAYVQSHDQVGNRATGERLHQLCGIARAKLAAGLLFASPFVPMIFQGEEWAASTPFLYFAQLESPELREAVRVGRAEHAVAGWAKPSPDPTDPATRDASVLRWDERHDGHHGAMFAWYRELCAARQTYPSLRDPHPAHTHVTRSADDRSLVIDRGDVALVCNFADIPAHLEPTGDVVLASCDLASHRELPPMCCALVRK